MPRLEPKPVDHPDLHTRHPLPTTLRADGRPVWEPPPINYGFLINEEVYAKQRTALLKYYNGDVVKVTHFLDVDAETEIFYRYAGWVFDQHERGRSENAAPEEIRFYRDLGENLEVDFADSFRQRVDLDVKFALEDDGTYTAMTREEKDRWWDRKREAEKAAADKKKEEEAKSTLADEAAETSTSSENHGEETTDSSRTGTQPYDARITLLAPSEPDETTALLPRGDNAQEPDTSNDDEDTDSSVLPAWCSCPCI